MGQEWKKEIFAESMLHDPFGRRAFARKYYSDYLAHHGILGQKWGMRRFQNADGTLTAAGKERYGVGSRGNGAKTLTGAYGRYQRRQNITRATAKAASTAAALGLGTAGAIAGTVATGNPEVGFLTGTMGGYAGAAIGVVAKERAKNKLEKRMLEDNDVKTNRIVIEKGQEFKRTSVNTTEEDNNNPIYASSALSKYDLKYYEEQWPSYLKKFAENPDTKIYQNTYEVKASLVAPSLEERKKTAAAIVNANKDLRIEFAKTYAMDQLRLRTGILQAKDITDLLKRFDNGYKQKIDDLMALGKSQKVSSKELHSTKKRMDELAMVGNHNLHNAYDAYVQDMIEADKIDMNSGNGFRAFTASIPTSPKLMKAYVDSLKKQGFDAVYDDNSNGEAPFIIFDRKMLKQTGSRQIA